MHLRRLLLFAALALGVIACSKRVAPSVPEPQKNIAIEEIDVEYFHGKSRINHKDDKKGHHDTFCWWWYENVGIQFTFPSTSNNRFGSNCDASAMLVLQHHHFIAFLDCLQENKQGSKFNHMEKNFWKALHCTAT